MQHNTENPISQDVGSYDYRNIEGDTILTRFLHSNRNDHLIVELIRRGCNVNKSGRSGCLPLHLSMSRPSVRVAHELVKHGAYIDALDHNGDTGLHCAVENNNVEALCMLLQHGADVTTSDSDNYTPLMLAINSENKEMTEALFWYYNDFSCVNIWGESALDLALLHHSHLALDLVEAGAKFSRCSGDNAALRSSVYNDSSLFKAIWSKLDPSIFLDTNGPFLINYLEICNFPVSEWIECLFMILSSPVAFYLIQDSRNYVDCFYMQRREYTVISAILLYCAYNGSKVDDRLALVYLCLSLGDVVTVADMRLTLQIYGFNEEIEALIYAGGFVQKGIIFEDPLLACILAFKEETDQDFIFNLFQNLIKATSNIDDAVKVLQFFAVSAPKKRQLAELSQVHFPYSYAPFCKKLELHPSVPSLVELSRNQARQSIKSAYGVDKAYQFHDVVKRLHVPAIVRDVLRFKAPIYKNYLDL